MDKKISILMTSYNYSKYIAEAIESVINQSYPYWELIIVDDASSDNSAEIIKQYAAKDNRIKPIFHKKNLGLAGAIQSGLDNITTDWVMFLESDDIFYPNAIEEKIKAIPTKADLIFSDVEFFQDPVRIKETEDLFNKINNTYVKLDESKYIDNFAEIIAKVNFIPTFSAVLVKTKLIRNCRYSSHCKSCLDHYLWSQLADKKIYYINKKLVKWRLHPNSYIKKDNNSWLNNYLFKIEVYNNTLQNKSFISRSLLTLNYMRKRLFYIKLSRKSFKVNLLNDKYTKEINFN